MSKMADLMIEIEELLAEDLTASEISDKLDIDIDLVYDVMDALEEQEQGGETDDGYALASAGFGTDEDYGDAGQY